MLQLYEDKRPKEQGNLFLCYFQLKIGTTQESEGNTTEIRNLKIKDTIFFLDYYVQTNGAKDTKKIDANLEINYPGTFRYKYQSITLNNPLLLNPSQIGPNQYKLYFLYNNHLFLTSFNIDSSKEIYNHFVFDKLSNINKTEDDIKIILDKNIIYLLLVIDIILMIFKVIYDYERREEKRREEKRREEKRREEKRREEKRNL